ncbi:MAG: AAA domain-containing protein, partial [Terriglobia bacterium]
GLDQRDLAVVRADAEVLQAHLASGKGLGISVRFNPFVSKGVRAALYLTDHVRVNGRPCDSPTAIADLLDFIEVTEAVDYIGQQWSPYVQARQMPIALSFREHEQRAEVLRGILQLRQLAAVASAALKEFCGLAQINFNDKQALSSILGILRMATIEDELRSLREKLASLNKQLVSFRIDLDANPVISELTAAVESRDLGSYSRIYDQVVSAWSLRSRCQRRETLERRLNAPTLSSQIAADPNVWNKRLEYFESAWNWARANYWLKQQSDPHQESALLEKVDISQKRIRHDLSELAAYKAWEHVLARLKPEQREHLMAWKLAIKKIGKGTGKYATQYRKEARHHLDHCRGAIPAWVMPIYRVAETTKPKPNMFDVAIIDEASQSGPEALFLLYIAKKIVVVGDDQQISPESVGLDREAVDSLRQRYIRDVPHWDALGVDNSFFDQAQIRFAGRIRLREHFRCMPEIIQFSNNLCYQGEPLIPLRQYGVERLVPVVTRHVRDGYAKGSGDRIVNLPEAEAIVEQIAQCITDPAYDGKGFGVICLQGNAQWNLIRDLLMDRIGAQKMQQRRLAGGNAYAFQGDERDIIFLSMVAATNDGRRIGVLSKEADKRRFNVAASRARDQMWLFHSVTLDDLSAYCLRRQLLEYCLNPILKQETIGDVDINQLRRQASEVNRGDSRAPLPFDSWFEVDVFLRIIDRGFRVIPQYPMAGKRIDLLVEGMQGRLAVECDGDQWHGIQEWDSDVDRQRMLERCGLQFWRVRGSAFYRSPDSALDPLWRLLRDRGIHATPPDAQAVVQEPEVKPSGQARSSDSTDEEDFRDGVSLAVDAESEIDPIEATDEGQRSPFSSRLEAGLPITLAPYEEWVPDAAPDPNSVSLPELLEGLIDIVAAEGPIVCRRAYSLYNKAAGNARLGSQIVRLMNRAIYRAVRLGRLRQSDEHRRGGQINQIVRVAGAPEVVVRQRGPRPLEEIPPLEIRSVRDALLSEDPTLGEDQLVRRLAGVYGIGRVTAQMRKLLLG